MPQPTSDASLFDIVYTCRAMRRLKPDPVPKQTLLDLVDAALQAPSGSNAQNWRFVIVTDPEQKQKVEDIGKVTWDFYLDTFARADQRPGEDLDARRRMLKAGTYMVTHMHEAPAIVFVGVKQDQAVANVLRSPSTLAAFLTHFGPLGMARVLASTPRITALADGSTAYPAVQNLLLAARALGLGAVLTTPQFFVPGQFEALLDLPSDFTLAAVIPVGYPMGKFGKVKRPGAEEVVSWERYEG